MTSHATCTHPATKAERTKCRAARASEATVGPVRTTQATSERRRAAARENLSKQGLEDAPAPRTRKPTKKQQREAANAKRTAATRARHPQRPTSETCSCGSKAGWIDTRTGEPVCIKHVDYNHIKIIPF